MNIVVIGHPEGFLGSQSMPRMARYIADGFRDQQHSVQVWSAKGARSDNGGWVRWGKWRSYLDQFVHFSWWMRRAVRSQPADTVYFFVDQALAPWVRWVRHRPHVVLVSDLLAIRSARGEFPQNRVRVTGLIYQWLIWAGLRQATHFIAVSRNTAADIQRLVRPVPDHVHVVYNGLNHPFEAMQPELARSQIQRHLEVPVPPEGYLLHVGGHQWYKNRRGVLQLYAAYVSRHARPPQLWIVGAAPTESDLAVAESVHSRGGQVRFMTGVHDEALNALYAGALLLLFPSLAEGFGWPIAEAMASGCLVLTTQAPPMTEVGGDAAFYLPAMPIEPMAISAWSEHGADVIHSAITLSERSRTERVTAGLRHVEQFATSRAIDSYVAVCERVLNETRG